MNRLRWLIPLACAAALLAIGYLLLTASPAHAQPDSESLATAPCTTAITTTTESTTRFDLGWGLFTLVIAGGQDSNGNFYLTDSSVRLEHDLVTITLSVDTFVWTSDEPAADGVALDFYWPVIWFSSQAQLDDTRLTIGYLAEVYRLDLFSRLHFYADDPAQETIHTLDSWFETIPTGDDQRFNLSFNLWKGTDATHER